MSVNRNARLAVVCILLTAITTCSRRHETQDFLPSAPPTQNALQVTNVGEISLPADGVSTVRIEAQISPDANVTRTIRFQTTLGGWVETTATSAKLVGAGPNAARVGDERAAELPQEIFKEADTAGRAAAFLQSTTTEGTAVVTVSVVARDSAGNVTDTFASVTREVSFVRVSDALTLADPDDSQAVADGASEVELVAQISADSPQAWQTVVFSTNLGRFGITAGAPDMEVKVTADATRTARARLVSDDEGTATVTAMIEEFEAASVTKTATFGPVPTGQISVTPGSWAAGDVMLGSTAQQTFTIGNHGNSELAVTAIALDSTDMGFSVQIPTIPIIIQPGQSEQVTVSFAPADEGAKSANLTITSDDPDAAQSTISVPLTGTGVAVPDISVDGSLAFGPIDKDTTETRVLTVRNVGSDDLDVTDITVAGAGEFTFLPSTTDFTIVPGGSWDLSVTFDPAGTADDFTATLTIESNDPDEAVKAVALTGTSTSP